MVSPSTIIVIITNFESDFQFELVLKVHTSNYTFINIGDKTGFERLEKLILNRFYVVVQTHF